MSGSPEAASVQLQDEVGREGREKLLSSADFCKEITPHEALAMKANLGLPLKKLRIMSRYMYMPNTRKQKNEEQDTKHSSMHMYTSHIETCIRTIVIYYVPHKKLAA